MNPKFKIESVTIDRNRAYVRAAIVNPKYFAVTAGSKLGGVRLSDKAFVEPQTGVFIFCLEDAADSNRFIEGDNVELETP